MLERNAILTEKRKIDNRYVRSGIIKGFSSNISYSNGDRDEWRDF